MAIGTTQRRFSMMYYGIQRRPVLAPPDGFISGSDRLFFLGLCRPQVPGVGARAFLYIKKRR